MCSTHDFSAKEGWVLMHMYGLSSYNISPNLSERMGQMKNDLQDENRSVLMDSRAFWLKQHP
ncbi:hypothetical protein CR513_21991, partial [Mucuna pruriens]